MQWQRVLHSCCDVIENAGRVHSIYEFNLKGLPNRIIRVKVIETPEGQFYGIPDHILETEEGRVVAAAPIVPTHSPESALQDAVCYFRHHFRPPYDHLRLVRIQSW